MHPTYRAVFLRSLGGALALGTLYPTVVAVFWGPAYFPIAVLSNWILGAGIAAGGAGVVWLCMMLAGRRRLAVPARVAITGACVTSAQLLWHGAHYSPGGPAWLPPVTVALVSLTLGPTFSAATATYSFTENAASNAAAAGS